MRVYLDICSIKRPYDDQAQTRIMLETAAVLVVLQAAEEGRVTLLRSIAHDIENSQNPDHRRATAVRGVARIDWTDGKDNPIGGSTYKDANEGGHPWIRCFSPGMGRRS